MPLVYPIITELARWAQNTHAEIHRVLNEFGHVVSEETTYTTDRYDPVTDTTALPLGREAKLGETLIVVARFKDPYGHISRPFFTRSREYLEDLPGLDVNGDPELQQWEYDQEDPGPLSTTPLEHWSFRPTKTLPPETLIRIRGCTVVHVLHVDQLCYRQGFPVLPTIFDPAAPHTHYNSADYPPDLHFYTVDRELQVLPVLAVGAYAFQIGGLGMDPLLEQQVPEEQFVLDGENTAWPKISGDQINDVTYSYASGGTPPAPGSFRVRHRMYPGYRILKRPQDAVGDREHFSGVFTESDPPDAAYTTYLNYRADGAVQFYTIQIRESGRWMFNLATYHGWYFRTDIEDGNVWVRRARGAEPPFDSEMEVTSGGLDSRPVLYLDGERLYLLFGRAGNTPGAYRCYSDDDGVTWSAPAMVIPDGQYPFAVVEPCSGNVIEAAYVDGEIKGRLITSGGEVGTLKTFKDATGAALPVEASSFSLAWQDDAQARLILVVQILGEDEISEWRCTDGGSYFVFQRIPA